ncbi:unnamed protein product [Brassica napus]|uniref:(rape) hypothetical protein n=1 Tax=Brassica napus TaxID=3708 RepID=A0A817B552_BRANA|nr:unnamed protein product [Brassica napus]
MVRVNVARLQSVLVLAVFASRFLFIGAAYGSWSLVPRVTLKTTSDYVINSSDSHCFSTSVSPTVAALPQASSDLRFSSSFPCRRSIHPPSPGDRFTSCQSIDLNSRALPFRSGKA